MNEMIERVAKAIFEKMEFPDASEAEAYARAAVEEMREPTANMIAAELRSKWPALYRDHIYLDTDGKRMRLETDARVSAATKGYRSMIDAALK